MPEIETCPACGALPCDWTENPFRTPQPTETQRIVAWLRQKNPHNGFVNHLADAIEAGEHLAGEGDKA